MTLRDEIIIDGNKLIDKATDSDKRIAYYEKRLKGTVVVNKDFLRKICIEWGDGRGEVTVAKFLLGTDKDYFLQQALNAMVIE